jgi:para-aminobenzoate synthetase component 1
MVLNSNGYGNSNPELHEYKQVIAAGIKCSISGRNNNLNDLYGFLNRCKKNNEFAFGYFTYDIKNQLETLHSKHEDEINFPDYFFFVPEVLYTVDAAQDELLVKQLKTYKIKKPINLTAKVSKEIYTQNVEQIKQHIINGDVYELNYCIEFYAKDVNINPLQVYAALNQCSPTPFSAYLQKNNLYLMCASPERFLKKTKQTIYSQPIKGTIRRGETEEEDKQLKKELLNSEKERAENLMIVDLVRNDLAKSCETGSIKVNELFGIYSFNQVHQMISTVSGKVLSDIHNLDIIKNAFPMGSMTGAPKVMAMKLIEQYEATKRGLYSGAVGYFNPNGDFDFNVVIRSLQYNSQNRYLSAMVGSAITYDSIAYEEYNECLLKARAIMQALK